jgi:hypothetical protein
MFYYRENVKDNKNFFFFIFLQVRITQEQLRNLVSGLFIISFNNTLTLNFVDATMKHPLPVII